MDDADLSTLLHQISRLTATNPKESKDFSLRGARPIKAPTPEIRRGSRKIERGYRFGVDSSKMKKIEYASVFSELRNSVSEAVCVAALQSNVPYFILKKFTGSPTLVGLVFVLSAESVAA